MNQVEKRRAVFHLSQVPHEVPEVDSIAKKSFARVVAINKDIDVLYVREGNRRMSDVESISRGLVPEPLVNKYLSGLRPVSSPVDHTNMSDDDIMEEARFNDIGLERSERLQIGDELHIFDPPQSKTEGGSNE